MAFSSTATASSDFLSLRKPPLAGSDSSLLSERYTISLTTADLATNTVGAIGILPAGHVPVAFELDASQLDSNGTPTLALSVGVLNSAQTALSTATADGGAAWATGVTSVGRAAAGSASGFVASRPLKTVTPTQTDRMVGVQFTAGAATAVAGAIALTLYFRPA